MQWREETLRGRGVNLHVRRVLEPPAPQALLLHGLGVGGAVYQSFARRLLPEFAAVAPDLRGHGQSDAPPSGYSPHDYASDLAELPLDWPVPVIGHSLGALVAMTLAQEHPRQVRWLALLDPPFDAELRNPEVPNVYRLRHAAPGELEGHLLERNPGGGTLLAELLARLFRQASDAAFEAMLERPTFTPSRVSAPTLVIQADPEAGGILGDDAARKAVAALGNAQLVKIPRAPHAVFASHPKEVSDAIKRFSATL